MKTYAVKYLDDNGFVTSNGYAVSMTHYEPGKIIEPCRGMRILIDFEIGD